MMALLWYAAHKNKWRLCERKIYDLPISDNPIFFDSRRGAFQRATSPAMTSAAPVAAPRNRSRNVT